MTVLRGESYVVETIDQFRRRLDVSWCEIARSNPNFREIAIEWENDIRKDMGHPPAENIYDIPNETFQEAMHEGESFGKIVENVLEDRHLGYTVVYDGCVIRIYKIHEQ